ncbi:hypothetical protein Pmani_016302 [Petrolisthes manimaculis]|uniref:Putative rRNA methyltransferase n=1 Tax=Petrolisthes manimaculis TaxID=1843537 RepID=A0AAE1PRY3_9EUCA|nr:hypothetical protein Pmani_016302 [Petrolisthes manimaculis]
MPKTGAARKDRYYLRARREGYRARSAYKLIQLNERYGFLQKSRVCVDLCSSPGSWMQVAKKYMPVSSLIVGVDLYPISPLPGAITIVGDITTDKLRQELKTTLKTWKADIVLHDGAPNVGANWLQDAYQQNLLTLHAFKLACEVLQKGGIFLTKVFRSKDYFSLEYVFRKLFKKVEATKPAASRYVSAEIFVLCQGFLAPAKIDPQFFSAEHVFQDIQKESQTSLNILKPLTSKPKAEGYEDGATTLYYEIPVSDFINEGNFLEILQRASRLEFDDEALKNHKRTTPEIIENCKDIKVLGRKDLRLLLSWRKHIRADMKLEKEKEEAEEAAKLKEQGEEEKKVEGEEEEKELEKLDKEIKEMKMEQAQEEKRDRKRKKKEKNKLKEKLRLLSVIPGDTGPSEQAAGGLFNLEELAQAQNIDKVVDQDADVLVSESEDEFVPKAPKYVKYKVGETVLHKSGRYYLDPDYKGVDNDDKSDSGSDVEGLGMENKDFSQLEGGEDAIDNADKSHPLLTDLVGDSEVDKRARKAENWFDQDVFKDLETEAVEDYEIDASMSKFKARGGEVIAKEEVIEKRKKRLMKKEEKVQDRKKEKSQKRKEEKLRKKMDKPADDIVPTSNREDMEIRMEEQLEEQARDAPDSDSDSDNSDSSDGSDSDDPTNVEGPNMPRAAVGAGGGVLVKKSRKKKEDKNELDEIGLALATKMIHSKKVKRNMIDDGWNRYMFGDEEDVPAWFVNSEKKHNAPEVEVEPEDLRMYRDRNKNVNVRTIKKVVEAKARKWRRTKKLMEKARKKAENVTGSGTMSEREKAHEIKRLYKTAMAPLKKKDTKYVVMKKKNLGKKPKGTKGPYKMVDKRLKKDKRAAKLAASKKSKKGRRK